MLKFIQFRLKTPEQLQNFPVEVLVDTVTSRENVRRMAERLDYKVEIITQGDEFKLVITK